VWERRTDKYRLMQGIPDEQHLLPKGLVMLCYLNNCASVTLTNRSSKLTMWICICIDTGYAQV